MREQAEINKTAWEYRAYEFWNMNYGTPAEKAVSIKSDPLARLDVHRKFFENVAGKKIANPCGSNGRRAVPLAVLGADVTVFDISEENKRYALELAKEAGADIQYVVGDFCETNPDIYGNAFDIIYAEGGILHYFSEIDVFINMLYTITCPGGQLILNDFHPFRKVIPAGSSMMSASVTEGDYFNTQLYYADVAYQKFFPNEEQEAFPKCLCRLYTMSEIINAVLKAGFVLDEFLEHPNYENKYIPGLFTIVASKRKK